MTNKSGVSAQVISVPKGGGALRGIGETFLADLHTGTGSFNLPLSLPPGRNGFRPQLSLAYSTGNPNGPYGLGWNIGIPQISRKTASGVPRYRDASTRPDDWDTFILAGADDLVPVSGGTAGALRYRPRTEGLFAHIERHRDPAPNPDPANDYWRVRSRDGLISEYGRRDADGELAVIADPDPTRRGSRIFAWKLTRTTDPFGNRIEYLYQRDAINTEPSPFAHRWDQLYLSEIRYGDHGAPSEAPQFLVKIRFRYQPGTSTTDSDRASGLRPDPFSSYRAGFEIRTIQRCTRIEIFVCAGGDESLVRSYMLTYADPPPPNGVSLLQAVQVIGHDGAESEALPPLTFGYTAFTPKARRGLVSVRGQDLPPQSLAHPDYELADLSGDGLPDVIEMNGVVRYWRNRGGGEFDRPQMMPEAPAGVRLADPGVQLVDADGDARIDLLVTGAGRASGYYPLEADGVWHRRTFRPYRVAPSFVTEDPEVRLVDLTGDGRVDLLRSGSRFECFFNNPERGWTFEDARWVERRPPEDFPDVAFSDQRVRWADMSGDGLQDIVLVSSGKVEYWPSLGHGDWGRRVLMHNSPRLPSGYNPRRVLLGDVDGDGLADLLYVEDTKVTLWSNRGGNSWSEPVTITGTPSVSDVDAVRLVDLLGNGVSGVLWTSEPSVGWRHRLYFLDLTGGGKPYLLDQIDNRMGSTTRVEYAPSTRFLLADRRCPGTRWRTSLPFPVQVVARTEVLDQITGGKLTTEYAYHHGVWDGASREFCGFARVDQRDTEVFDQYNRPGLHPRDREFRRVGPEAFSPPTELRTWFHPGPVADGCGGWEELDLHNEYWCDDPSLLSTLAASAAFLQQLPRGMRRDALRGLRGRPLRTELYSCDGTDAATRPISVTEYAYGIAPVVDEAPVSAAQRVFLPYLFAERVSRWERGDDPMTRVTFTDHHDELGRPRQRTVVALPRRQARQRVLSGTRPGEVRPDERRLLAAHTRTDYAIPDPGLYLHSRVAQVRAFELTTPGEVVERNRDDPAAVLRDGVAAAIGAHRRFRDLLDPWEAGRPLPAGVRLLGHTINHYDGGAFTGRPVGQIGPHGALVRVEALVWTEAGLDAAYLASRPTYLGGPAKLPAGAPAGFGSALGYRRERAGPDGYHDGYYADREAYEFDVQQAGNHPRRGFAVGRRDALGNEWRITPDPYWLLPAKVVDPAGLVQVAKYDYRVSQVSRLTDPNGNTVRYRFSPLGMLQQQVRADRLGGGDTDARPELSLRYDYGAFERSRNLPEPQPVYVHTCRRVWRASDGIGDDTIETREYYDGYGRLVQRRAQAPELAFGPDGQSVGLPVTAGTAPTAAIGQRDPARVLVSGWKVHDNKGRVVEDHQPLLSRGWAFNPAERGQAAATIFRYDATGEVVWTVEADGAQRRVIKGIPTNLNAPDAVAPTPWERSTYDANDLAPFSQDPQTSAPLIEVAPAAHYHTPESTVLDALDRIVCRVERAGPLPERDWHITNLRYDQQGNVIEVHDPLGRTTFRYVYDLLGRQSRITSIDAGTRTLVHDAAGNQVERRNGKGGMELLGYDALGRPTGLWARDTPTAPLTLRQRLIYGDRLPNAANSNLAGHLYQHYDEAGLQQFERYDLTGKVVDKWRRVISDAALAVGWKGVDWSAVNAAAMLAQTRYRTTTRYDALERPIEVRLPADVNGHRAILRPSYDRGGNLMSISLDGKPYARLLAYDARGRRTLIIYGNGLMTRHAYDRASFRLRRLRTERYEPATGLDNWTGRGPPLQDIAYDYDLVGNVTAIDERTPRCGVAGPGDGPDRLVRTFTYDPIYRLIAATGRACSGKPPHLVSDLDRCGSYRSAYHGQPPVPNQANSPWVTERYTERYAYDPLGNLLRVERTVDTRTTVRRSGLGNLPPDRWREAPNNQLTSQIEAGSTLAFQFDANGNLEREGTERHYGWDHADRMVSFTCQPAGSTQASLEVRYLYDAAGTRVKRWIRRKGWTDSVVEVDGVFEHAKTGAAAIANNWIHVLDGTRRIALVRLGPASKGDAGPPVQYHLPDLVGSSQVVVDSAATWVNREEYTPYGDTAFGGFAHKRYRFNGRERDEETGLYAFGARFYAPRLARWTSCDPAGFVDGWNLYTYARGNPVTLREYHGNLSGSEVVNATKDAGPQVVGLVQIIAMGGGAALAEALAIPVLVVTAIASIGVIAYAGYQGYKLHKFTKEVEARQLYTQRQVLKGLASGDISPLDYYFINGEISLADYQRYKSMGLRAPPLLGTSGTGGASASGSGAPPKPGTVDFVKFAQRAFASRFCETPALRDLWKSAAAGLPNTKAGFATARERFWDAVNNSMDPNAQTIRDILAEAGYELQGGTRAPLLKDSGWDPRATRELADRRLSIDHADPQSANTGTILDPCNLRFMTQRDNSIRGARYSPEDQPL